MFNFSSKDELNKGVLSQQVQKASVYYTLHENYQHQTPCQENEKPIGVEGQNINQ